MNQVKVFSWNLHSADSFLSEFVHGKLTACLFQLIAFYFFILEVFFNSLHTEISAFFSVYDAILQGSAL
jgi:hypothetical protein